MYYIIYFIPTNQTSSFKSKPLTSDPGTRASRFKNDLVPSSPRTERCVDPRIQDLWINPIFEAIRKTYFQSRARRDLYQSTEQNYSVSMMGMKMAVPHLPSFLLDFYQYLRHHYVIRIWNTFFIMRKTWSRSLWIIDNWYYLRTKSD